MTKSAVSVDLFTSTEEIVNGKLHFLCSVHYITSSSEQAIYEEVIPRYVEDVLLTQ